MNSPGKRTVAASDGGTAAGRDLHIYLIDLRRTRGSSVTIEACTAPLVALRSSRPTAVPPARAKRRKAS